MTSIIIVEKNANLKTLKVKDFNENDLYKKCGFKKADDFEIQHTWENITHEDKKYMVTMSGKSDGKAGSENKYDFPPPIDTILFFGSCSLVAYDQHTKQPVNLSLELWDKLYNHLMGGFDDTCDEDEEEEEEQQQKEDAKLKSLPSNLKTKTGEYLKDGFVVDSDESDISEVQMDEKGENEISSADEEEEYSSDADDDNDNDNGNNDDVCEEDNEDNWEDLPDDISELTTESYV
jgi:hypothetical protein